MTKRIMRSRKSNPVGQVPSARLLEDTRRRAPAPKWLRDAWDLAEKQPGRK